MIILDLETDGLWPEVTAVHCAVAYDTEADCTYSFVPDHITIPEEQIGDNLISHIKYLPEFLYRNCVTWEKGLSCHNGIGFDLKVLRKVLNCNYDGKYFDTLLASRILWPDIDGGHSVDAWGKRFGVEKPKHEDWSKYSAEMLHRCQEDIKIQSRLFEYVEEEMKRLSEEDPRIDFDKVFRLEHKVWKIIEEQHDYGWKIDLEHAFRTRDIIEAEFEKLKSELTYALPLRVIKSKTVTKAFKASGEPTVVAKNWLESKVDLLSGDFSKVEFEPTNPGSPDQIKAYLLSQGWEPLNWNYQKDKFGKAAKDKYGNKVKTSPKMPKDEEWEIVEQLTDNHKIKLIARFYIIRHRRGLINSFIENCDMNTHRIHYDVITCMTNTARMGHRIVVNVPRVE